MTSGTDNLPEQCAFHWWKPAAWLSVSGEDSFAFLQGQLSNDLRVINTAGSVYGLWLNHKGRVLADSFVVRRDVGSFWVGSYFSPAAQIRERLEGFIIADDVMIEDMTEAWCAISVMPAPQAPALPQHVSGVSFEGRRSRVPAVEWVFPDTDDNKRIVTAIVSGGAELTALQMEEMRIRDGVPAVPVDVGAADLPNEARLEETAVSYSKGCYLGQEVMARLKTMGQLRRRLMRVRGNGARPTLPAALFDGERRVGELRSAVATADGYVGLAMITLLQLRPGAPLAFAANNEEAPVMLVDQP